jgi:hypothetical protein
MALKSRKRRKQRQDFWGYILILLAFLGAVCLVSLFLYWSSKQTELDRETYCPKNGPQDVCAILVDQTDTFSVVQRADIQRHLDEVKLEVPQYGCIELYTIAPIKTELLKPIFKMCNPGRGEQVNPLIGNPQIVERRWREEFSNHLDRSLEELLTPSQASATPLFESLQSVAISAFGHRAVSQVRKRLIIVSDMIHHSSEFSQYNDAYNFQSFRSSDYYMRIRPILKEVEIEIFYLHRATHPQVQGKKHIEFWQSFITDCGGTLTKVVRIGG